MLAHIQIRCLCLVSSDSFSFLQALVQFSFGYQELRLTFAQTQIHKALRVLMSFGCYMMGDRVENVMLEERKKEKKKETICETRLRLLKLILLLLPAGEQYMNTILPIYPTR